MKPDFIQGTINQIRECPPGPVAMDRDMLRNMLSEFLTLRASMDDDESKRVGIVTAMTMIECYHNFLGLIQDLKLEDWSELTCEELLSSLESFSKKRIEDLENNVPQGGTA